MDDPLKIDLAIVARDLKLPPEKIERTVVLLDEGNTIPFITRFRKDLTGGLNEQQILAVKQRVTQLRALAERKAFVLKSIDSQGKLTDKLKTEIGKTSTSRRLEDLYLPFKPKKQSRALVAKQQGLEPLANDIFEGVSPEVDIATRATDFVRVDKGVKTVDDVFKGVRDLMSERFGENEDLRAQLRKILWNEGKLSAQLVVIDEPGKEGASEIEPTEKEASATDQKDVVKKALPAQSNSDDSDKVQPLKPVQEKTTESAQKSDPVTADKEVAEEAAKPATQETPADAGPEPTSDSTSKPVDSANDETPANTAAESKTETSANTVAESKTETPIATEPPTNAATESTSIADPSATSAETEPVKSDAGSEPAIEATQPTEGKVEEKKESTADSTDKTAKPKSKKKKKKKKKTEDPFNDYHDFKQPLKQIPHHRVLAINRGERAGKLNVKIDIPTEKLQEPTFAALVPAEHPFKEFMQKCAGDALNRVIVPSLEREIRRELNESAEKHAVEVFANNLRNLLLQPPVRNRVVVAIDPGFKRGCSVAVVDPCGNAIESGHIFVVGNKTRREEGKQKVIDWIKNSNAKVVAIGNGSACRQVEQLVSDVINENFKEQDVRYVMVNEAGASTYSTSEIGREELPDATPSIRSAISIGRRLQDPLSELVKIEPGHIGVGMYQHDVKAKHLSESLDAVVEFCVNQVGVNVNTASPSLLKYVSGLNALTARRLVEYRESNGQFKNREELKKVAGVGDATFVQAAGFLRIHEGDNPLDSTAIHPESYPIANDVLKRVNTSVDELFIKPKAIEPASPAPVEPVKTTATEATAQDTEKATAVEPKSESSPATAEAAEASTSEASTAQPSTTETKPVEPPASTAQPSTTETKPVEPPASEQTANAQPVETTAAAQSAPSQADSSATDGSATSESKPDPPKSETATEPEPAKPASPKPAMPKLTPAELEKRKEVFKQLSELDVDKLAGEHSTGRMLIKDIVMSLKRPDWDPRGRSKKLIFRSGIIKADDLKVDMQLEGQVVNVVDFGVFVDIGLGESSLVHVSQLSNHFVRDPHQLYAVGDILKVWVSEIDSQRRRVKLTAVRPGTVKQTGKRKFKPRNTKSSDESSRANTSRGPRKPGKYEGGSRGKSGSRNYSKGSYKPRPPRKPKPVKPITEGMLKGKEPMRSFSDLAQFVKKAPAKNSEKDEKESKSKDS